MFNWVRKNKLFWWIYFQLGFFSTTRLQLRKRENLTTHSTHFIYGYMASDMVKDHSDSEKGNPLPPHRLLLSINSKGSFICTIPQPLLHQSWSTGWTRNSSMGPPHEGSIRRPIAPWANALTTELRPAPPIATGYIRLFHFTVRLYSMSIPTWPVYFC